MELVFPVVHYLILMLSKQYKLSDSFYKILSNNQGRKCIVYLVPNVASRWYHQS